MVSAEWTMQRPNARGFRYRTGPARWDVTRRGAVDRSPCRVRQDVPAIDKIETAKLAGVRDRRHR